ncbi:OmpA family protein [Lysobacter sp. HDW10]|uniref:OmpA family protein n=1 Tax=Lysobacter sp. HDW10 TaxID=2714936 RepID=UPI001F0FB54E|nr:OmpA family protein [Lysobacter sp. HDW10]
MGDVNQGSDARHARLYFDSGSAALPGNADDNFRALLDTMKADMDSRAVISGYHDASGDAAVNAALSKQRAEAVRDALVAHGIASGRLDLEKPMVATGGAAGDREGRRVEVSIQ